MRTLDNRPRYHAPRTLVSYANGNCQVTLLSDGTKTREWDGVAMPEFPESVDLKITDYCDLGCPYCHEMSTQRGKHGDLTLALKMWEGLPAGVEIAIGGGNPLSHPLLLPFLETCRARGHVCNLTVNQMHVEPFRDLINHLVDSQLIMGLGISVRDMRTLFDLYLDGANVVYHLILGLNTFDEFKQLAGGKTLLLGYKTFGWGIKYGERHPDIDDCLKDWRRNMPHLLQSDGITSFDNLAIEQLELRRWIAPDKWDAFYMGDDGAFTMYVDVVKSEFARGSTATERHPIEQTNLREAFSRFAKYQGVCVGS